MAIEDFEFRKCKIQEIIINKSDRGWFGMEIIIQKLLQSSLWGEVVPIEFEKVGKHALFKVNI